MTTTPESEQTAEVLRLKGWEPSHGGEWIHPSDLLAMTPWEQQRMLGLPHYMLNSYGIFMQVGMPGSRETDWQGYGMEISGWQAFYTKALNTIPDEPGRPVLWLRCPSPCPPGDITAHHWSASPAVWRETEDYLAGLCQQVPVVAYIGCPQPNAVFTLGHVEQEIGHLLRAGVRYFVLDKAIPDRWHHVDTYVRWAYLHNAVLLNEIELRKATGRDLTHQHSAIRIGIEPWPCQQVYGPVGEIISQAFYDYQNEAYRLPITTLHLLGDDQSSRWKTVCRRAGLVSGDRSIMVAPRPMDMARATIVVRDKTTRNPEPDMALIGDIQQMYTLGIGHIALTPPRLSPAVLNVLASLYGPGNRNAPSTRRQDAPSDPQAEGHDPDQGAPGPG
jgi:hypothetical protein